MSEGPVHFTDDSVERRKRSLWKRLLRVHLVLLFFAGLALALVDPRLWQFFGIGVVVLSLYACLMLVFTRGSLLTPNIACNDCGAVGFPGDLKAGEGRCQRCGSERMWVKGKRLFPRPDTWQPGENDEPPPGFRDVVSATGTEILDGAVKVRDGFGARTGGD